MPNEIENGNQPIVLAGLAISVDAVFMTKEQARALHEPGGLFESVTTSRILICEDGDTIARLLGAVAHDLAQVPNLGEAWLDRHTSDELVVTQLPRRRYVMRSTSGYSPYGPAHHRRWPQLRSNRPHLRNRKE